MIKIQFIRLPNCMFPYYSYRLSGHQLDPSSWLVSLPIIMQFWTILSRPLGVLQHRPAKAYARTAVNPQLCVKKSRHVHPVQGFGSEPQVHFKFKTMSSMSSGSAGRESCTDKEHGRSGDGSKCGIAWENLNGQRGALHTGLLRQPRKISWGTFADASSMQVLFIT